VSEPPFTWEDVNWLRKEAGRYERCARRRNMGAAEVAGNAKKAERYRSLANRIEKALQSRAA